MVLSSVDLTSIARRLKKGDDNKAYHEFFRYFGPRLRSFYLRRGVSDAEHVALELLNEIAWKKIHKYTENGKFPAWVRRVALNHFYDLKRKSEDLLPLREDLVGESLYGDDVASVSETEALVQRAVAKLSKLDRDIIRLHYQGDCETLAKVAKRLRVNFETVRTRHSRALKKLQRELEGMEHIRARYLA